MRNKLVYSYREKNHVLGFELWKAFSASCWVWNCFPYIKWWRCLKKWWLADERLCEYGIWNKLERWKSSINLCLMIWMQIKKIIILKCRFLLFYAIMNHFSIWLCYVMTFHLWYVTKSGSYIIGNKQLSGWTEKKLQSTY